MMTYNYVHVVTPSLHVHVHVYIVCISVNKATQQKLVQRIHGDIVLSCNDVIVSYDNRLEWLVHELET